MVNPTLTPLPQYFWGLNSNNNSEKKGFMFIIQIDVFATVRCNRVGSKESIIGPHTAPAPASGLRTVI